MFGNFRTSAAVSLLVVFLAPLCFAQWTTSGSNIYNTNSGNVGIGTTDPSTKLQVLGQLAAGANSSTQWGIGASSVSGNFNQAADQGIGFVLEGISTEQSAATATGSLMQFQQDYVSTWSIGMLPTQGRFSFILQRGIGGGTGTEVMSLAGSNVGIGTTAPGASLEVNGNVKLTSGSGGSITFPDGTTQSTAFIPANCGADYAESVDVTGNRTNYTPGDILVIDATAPGKFLKSNQAYSTLVAGVYSTQPGFVGRKHPADTKTDGVEVPMAMVGRVPTKVSAENGPINVGDLVVSSSTVGYAMKGTDRSQMLGAVIGKALGSLNSGIGVIEVLVTLQ